MKHILLSLALLLPTGALAFDIPIADTETVDMRDIGGELGAEVIVDPAAGNTLSVGPNGLFVPTPPSGVSADAPNDLTVGSDGLPLYDHSPSVLTDNGDGTYTHNNANGTSVTIDTASGVSSDAANDLSVGSDGLPYYDHSPSVVTDNGDGTFTHNNNGGSATTWDVTGSVSTLTQDDSTGDATHNDGNGTNSVIDIVSGSANNIAVPGPDGGSFVRLRDACGDPIQHQNIVNFRLFNPIFGNAGQGAATQILRADLPANPVTAFQTLVDDPNFLTINNTHPCAGIAVSLSGGGRATAIMDSVNLPQNWAFSLTVGVEVYRTDTGATVWSMYTTPISSAQTNSSGVAWNPDTTILVASGASVPLGRRLVYRNNETDPAYVPASIIYNLPGVQYFGVPRF